MNQCSICKKDYEGMGNNAHPINDGRCCDHCDCFLVIPTRIALIKGGDPLEDFKSLSASLLEMRNNPPIGINK